MPSALLLPRADGTRAFYTAGGREPIVPSGRPPRDRVAYAAAHVVCDPLAESDPLSSACLDWEATLAYRRYLWSMGLSVAEAMDTAQRGMGLDWETTQELIRRSVAEARACGGGIACGAGTDHLTPSSDLRLEDIEAAYTEQCAFVERQGARVILMASRALAAFARGPDDYRRPMAGYGGLFWRGPRGFQHGTIQAAGGLEGPDIMGQAAPWLAFMGRHDGNGEQSTLLFIDQPSNPRFPNKWFVRNDPYAGVSCSFMFDEPYLLSADETLVLDYRIVLGNGAWSRARIEEYVACGR